MPGQKSLSQNRLVFVWNRLEPSNLDQCEAAARRFAGRKSVIAIEFTASLPITGQVTGKLPAFQHFTLFQSGNPKRWQSFLIFWRLSRLLLKPGSAGIFFENYENSVVLVIAILLGLLGHRTFVLSNAKFDDEPRHKFGELRKFIFLLPYKGAMTSSSRGRDYLNFLGMPRERIFFGYDTVSIARIRHLSGAPPAPEGVPFDERVFVAAAQFMPAVHVSELLFAYKTYRKLVTKPRLLRIISSVVLEDEIYRKVNELSLSNYVTFCGGLSPGAVLKELSGAIALLLYDSADPFGKIVPEAQSLGLPVFIPETCGASDELVQSGVNGFVFEQNNPEGLAYFMSLLSQDAELWKEMCVSARQSSLLSDVEHFASGVEALTSPRRH